MALKDTTTKEKLIKAAIELFSKFGFDSTTTRMIANKAEVALSAISFHFGTKEELYKASLVYAAESISETYDEIYKKIETLYGYQDEMDRQRAWELITELIDLQLYISLDLPHKEFLTLLYWEQVTHPEDFYPITSVVYKKSENALALLLLMYVGSKNYEWAITISRTINGSIISFGEHPMFIRRALNMNDDSAELPIQVKNTVREFILNSIRHLANEAVK